MARVSPQPGSTKLKNPNQIEILYNAEIRDVGICEKLFLLFQCCKVFSRERSYLYVRENSLETNVATNCLCCKSWICEDTKVLYFDRPPFKPKPHYPCFPCFGMTDPKLEVKETGCWCCCQRIVCCEEVVIMPYENLPCPCCCCKNRTPDPGLCNCWLCFYGITGPQPLDHVPKATLSFQPQPKDPWELVKQFGVASGMKVTEKPGQQGMETNVKKVAPVVG